MLVLIFYRVKVIQIVVSRFAMREGYILSTLKPAVVGLGVCLYTTEILSVAVLPVNVKVEFFNALYWYNH